MSTPIDIPAVRRAAEKLEKARAALTEARKHYNDVKYLRGMQGYAVIVHGVHVQFARMERETYQVKLIRGMEMIHLGAQKALAAEINDLESDVADLESELRALVLTEKAR
ncbi:hypothetical protein [Xanthomonas albilineans]|uniref:hypothetical protein n=1 Tax=Xanthomonas albilineans TaxID=29447 RepID=UPI0012D48E0E|nr:hypothetical protein [Xanthomonas albilineans]